MQQHFLRVAVTEGMTIHAISVGAVVEQNRCLMVILQVLLVDSHFFPDNIACIDLPESNIRVNFFIRNMV